MKRRYYKYTLLLLVTGVVSWNCYLSLPVLPASETEDPSMKVQATQLTGGTTDEQLSAFEKSVHLFSKDEMPVTTQRIRQGAVPQGVSGHEWSAVLDQIDEKKYLAYSNNDGYESANPRNGLYIRFQQDGHTVLRSWDQEEGTFILDYKFSGIGYNDVQKTATNPESVSGEKLTDNKGSKVTYTWSENLTEWWENTEAGLEQWFRIEKAPQDSECEGPLRLQMAVATDLQMQVSEDMLEFTGIGRSFTYSKLKVWDATGKALSARFEASAEGFTLLIDDKEAVYPVTIDPVFSSGDYIKASNTNAGDNFGWSVAFSGETMVVGAPMEDSNATGVNGNQSNNSTNNSGAVYVFVRTGNVWTQQAYLKASNTNAYDNFGYSVAISGETIVVGAFCESSNATGVNGNQADNTLTYAGAAYVFVRSGQTWSQQAYLKASNTGAGDFFGQCVAISGETIVAGAHGEDSDAATINGNQTSNSASFAGAVYVFVRTGNVWTQQAYLKASNAGTGDYFGQCVAISGETIAVGAYHESSNASGINGNQADNSLCNSGAVYVFVRNGIQWSQQAYIKASNSGVSDYFGLSLAISGETLVVGAYGESSNATGVNTIQTDNSASQSGAAYVFVRSGNTWSQQAYLKASNTETFDAFGCSVAISGEVIVVGAWGEDSNAAGVNGNQSDNSVTDVGAAYVFVRSGNTWNQNAYLKVSNPHNNVAFSAVAVSGQTVVVGAFYENSAATGINGNAANNQAGSSGAVYSFSVATALPVVFKAFDYECGDRESLVSWEVENEINLKHYEIWSSENGFDFQLESVIPATGLSTYETVVSTENQMRYVQIRTVDTDGSQQEFGPFSIDCVTEKIVVYPNPSTGDYVIVEAPESYRETSMQLIDAMGRMVMIFTHDFSTTKQLVLPTTDLASGSYHIVLSSSSGNIETKEVVVVK